jgi:hypothetical protein
VQKRAVVRAVAVRICVCCLTFAVTSIAFGAPRSARTSGGDLGHSVRSAEALGQPLFETAQHDVGDFSIWASVGGLGRLWYPRTHGGPYLVAGGLYFGCVRGIDTLVTESNNQHWPRYDDYPVEFLSFEPMQRMSSDRNSPDYDPLATATQQFTFVYTDTAVMTTRYGGALDEVELRPHEPIGIEVTQTSYAWAASFARRLVLIDYAIKNISGRPISRACVAFYPDPDVGGGNPYAQGDTVAKAQLDDITGFLPVVPGIVPGALDTINTAWSADNDGDPFEPDIWGLYGDKAAVGVRVVRAPEGGRFSFNWMANDHYDTEWGPHRRGSDYGRSQGAPYGDRSRYRMMRNGEIDYDQVFAAVDMSGGGFPWAAPPSNRHVAVDLASGLDTRFMMSYGPLPDIMPGETIPFTVAVVIGDDLHHDPTNYERNFHSDNPQPFVNDLDFSGLILSARWADWVYDNPGVDTDGDGDRGAAYLVNCDATGCDSVFYKGDGVPDFRGPSAPPIPVTEAVSRPYSVTLHWSGAVTESATDPFAQRRDWEGYRVYIGKFDRDDQYALVASWDVVDYKRMAYREKTDRWMAVSDPHTEDEWKVIMDDTEFDVMRHSRPSFDDAFIDTVTDTTRNLSGDIISIVPRERYSYWIREDYNRGNAYWEADQWTQNLIQRVEDRDTVADGLPLTYGVYEITLDNLNPSVPLFFAVTTFDFGDYRRDFGPLESSPTSNSHYAEPIYESAIVEDSSLRVSVFPNPYRAQFRDGHGNKTTYYLEGFEGRGIQEFAAQDRRIHFINLPDTATIRIYSLDGDLIREIHHPDPYLTTYSSSVGWDLISRNTQAVVSGIYIWRVDSRLGTQMGKLVIIK